MDCGTLRQPWKDPKLLTEETDLFKASPTLTKEGKQASLERRSEEYIKRDLDQKAEQYRNELVESNILQMRRDSGYMAKANVGGAAYNIINKQYNDTIAGKRLKYHDNLVQYKKELRANHLATKNHAGYNPITGALTLIQKSPVIPDM